MKEKFKIIESQFRELGIEGDDVFTLIASEYIKYHNIEKSERLKKIGEKANSINCNGSKSKVEQILKKIISLEEQGSELSVFYQYFHSKRFRDNTGKFFTPRSIAQSMVSMLPIKSDAIIIDPTCGGGTFLLEALKKWGNTSCHLIGNDVDNYLVTLTELLLKIKKQSNHKLSFFNENIYSNNKIIAKYRGKVDYILANPPFSLTIENFNPKSKLLKLGFKNSDALFLDLAQDLLKEEGKLVCLLPHSIISNNEYVELRKTVESDWFINAIMVLPEGVFQETANTTTRADILVLKKKDKKNKQNKSNTLFCNISSIGNSINANNDLQAILEKQEVKKMLEIN